MFSISVTEKGGDQRRLEFDKAEVTIGRVQGNDVILPKGNVSKRHARIVLKDGKFIIVDLKSTNGTYVNGRKITSPLVVKDSDKIYIGDFILGVEESGRITAAPPIPEPERPPSREVAPPPPVGPAPFPAGRPASSPSAPPPLADAPPPAPPPPAPPPGAQPPPPVAMTPDPQPPPPVGLSTQPPPAPGSITANKAPRPGPSKPPPTASSAPSVAPAAPGPLSSPYPAASTGSAPVPKPRLVGAGASAVRRTSRPPTGTVTGKRGVAPTPLDPKVVKLLELQKEILARLIPDLELDKLPLDRLADEELWQRAESAIVDLVETMDSSGNVPKYIDQDQLIKETLNEALGLGPLEDLLADGEVDEILVDRRDRIIVGRSGAYSAGATAFSSNNSLQRVVERLVAPSGVSIDEKTPLVDVRLRDGSRLAAAIPPVSIHGTCLTLRKPSSARTDLAQLIDAGTLSGAIGDFLNTCIAARKNLLVCGAPSSGKSHLLSALASAAPAGERVVTVEEIGELSIERDDWVALEARPAVGNGVDSVGLRSLLRGALRMRPDRLVVGDVTGDEALDLIRAMASAVDGALASVSGDTAVAALSHLATLAGLGAPGASQEALRQLVAQAVDVVVTVARYADGVVRVCSIDEVLGSAAGGFDTRELFSFKGADAGGFVPSGVVPEFYGELEARGLPADTSIFRS